MHRGEYARAHARNGRRNRQKHANNLFDVAKWDIGAIKHDQKEQKKKRGKYITYYLIIIYVYYFPRKLLIKNKIDIKLLFLL